MNYYNCYKWFEGPAPLLYYVRVIAKKIIIVAN
jgi:hypothetical protein